MARREKKPVHKVVMTEGKRNIIQQLIQEYDIETAEDIQDALKDQRAVTIKTIFMVEQMATVDKQMIIVKTGHVDADSKTMEVVEAALRRQLEL